MVKWLTGTRETTKFGVHGNAESISQRNRKSQSGESPGAIALCWSYHGEFPFRRDDSYGSKADLLTLRYTRPRVGNQPAEVSHTVWFSVYCFILFLYLSISNILYKSRFKCAYIYRCDHNWLGPKWCRSQFRRSLMELVSMCGRPSAEGGLRPASGERLHPSRVVEWGSLGAVAGNARAGRSWIWAFQVAEHVENNGYNSGSKWEYIKCSNTTMGVYKM